MKSFNITFINKLSGLKEIIDIPDEKYILEAACEQNIELPSSFGSGTCSTCVDKLEKGDLTKRIKVFWKMIK